MKRKKAKYQVARHPLIGGGEVVVIATSVGNAMAKARREMGWTHYGSENDGEYVGYSVSILK